MNTKKSSTSAKAQEKSKSPMSGQKKTGTSKTQLQSSQLMQLFEDELKDIYWAEQALVKAIPKMIKNASSKDLIAALKSHLEETKGQVDRVEKVFSLIKVKAVAVKCEAMAGLIKEAEGIMEESEAGPMRDAGIISAAQKVEHYEIASYGTLNQFAKTLNLPKVAELLSATLKEEKNADLKLSDVAMSSINVKASKEEEE